LALEGRAPAGQPTALEGLDRAKDAILYFIPTIHFDKTFLSMLVAVIGTSLSAYLYTWQSNVEVEEKIASGRKRLSQRKGATEEELKGSRFDILGGMLFSNVIMYFIILSTAATLFKAGKTDINTAADAAQALRPLAGDGASLLFALGIIFFSLFKMRLNSG
jgi:Mn2+/Fe2+ NRAMP family transporter